MHLPAIENVTMKTELKSVIAVPAWPVSSRKSPNIIPNDEVGPNVVIWRKKINFSNILFLSKIRLDDRFLTSYINFLPFVRYI